MYLIMVAIKNLGVKMFLIKVSRGGPNLFFIIFYPRPV